MFGQPAGPAQGVQPDAQALCMELAKRMEDLYPVLQQAAGQRASPGGAGAGLQNNFVAYSYSFSSNPQLLQQANSGQFNPAYHVDYAKWAQAVQNNPAPQSCYPEPLVGLTALEQRLAAQQSAVEQCSNELEDLKTGFGNLKHALQAQSLQKLEECRRRHQKLSRQLLQVVAAIETYAVHTGAARRSPHAEGQLEDRFARLQEAVHAPASARARLEELWVVLRGLLQRGPPSGGAACLAQADAEKALRVTASQGELLELLQEELAGRKRDIAQFESALARFASSAALPAQTL
uniref:Nucleoporin Nup54 alpha-helical domain-containing protein n=1 Tax=Pyrodinium bahamense TaxID=73915 RepID=A0A7S0A713_9DINO